MTLLDDAVKAVAVAGGWKMPERDEAGAYRFYLQGGVDFAMFSPDGRMCVTRGEVRDVPAEPTDREELLSEVASRQVGVCRRRASVLALEPSGGSLLATEKGGDKLVLFRRSRLESGQSDGIAAMIRDFLNDLAWWRASLNGNSASSVSGPSFSPFGLAENRNTGGSSFWMGRVC